MSWDETAVYVAINGPAPYYKIVKGKVKVARDGSDTWTTPGNQCYIVSIRPYTEMQELINKLIQHQPGD